MARRRTSNAGETMNAWPGFVDALSTLLMVIIFVLLVFVLAQAFLSVALSSRDQALTQLHRKIAEMSDLLTLEHSRSDTLHAAADQANLALHTADSERSSLQQQLATLRLGNTKADSAQDQLKADRARLATQLDDERLQLQAAQARNSALQVRQADSAKLLDAAGQSAAVASAQLLEAQHQLAASAVTAEQRQAALNAQLGEKAKVADNLQAQIASLSDEMKALREQLLAVGTALNASEASAQDKDVQIANLGSRLNTALAQKIGELQQYRSEFFGRLRQVLANQPGVQVVGDRFVFQSEVLFPPGNAELSQGGLQQIAKLAQTLKEITPRIPADVNWLLRVDGHADRQSVLGTQYPSNWDLSAARAIKVVQLLAAEGVPANRLAATAFGDNQPLDLGTTPDAYAKNRRIEIRLTDR